MSRRTRLLDGSIVLGSLALGQVEVWLPDASAPASLAGPRWANAAAFAGASLVLVARRRRPLLTLGATVALLAIPALIWGKSESFGGLVPVLVATYAVGAHAPRVPVWSIAAAFAAAVGFDAVADPAFEGPRGAASSALFTSVILVAYLLGVVVRMRRSARIAEAERAAAAARIQEERLRVVLAEERTRVAHDLHDAVGHALSVIVLQAGAAGARLATDPAGARRSLAAIEATGRAALEETRRLVELLAPAEGMAVLDVEPDSVEALAERVRHAGLEVALERSGDASRVDGIVAAVVYRIVQEALTNVLRHAGARTARITIAVGDDAVAVEVADDGAGAARPLPGRGLRGMAARAERIGGSCEAGGAPGAGFLVRATLPLAEGTP